MKSLTVNNQVDTLVGFVQSFGSVPAIYRGIKASRNILVDVCLAILFTIIFIPVIIIFYLLVSKFQKMAEGVLEVVKASKLETEVDYNRLEKLHHALEFVHEAPNPSDLPFMLRIIVLKGTPLTNVMLETKDIVSNLLYPNPNNLTNENVWEQSQNLINAGFAEDWDDEDMDVYDKKYTLDQLNANKN